MSEKSELRASLKQSRHQQTEQQREARSLAICQRLESYLEWPSIEKIHCFEPIEHLGEVDVLAFFNFLETEHPLVQIYTSRLIGSTWHVVALNGEAMADDIRFDAVIVPMLGFDHTLNRIGYGGGYYDRFLATQPQAQKIGVCFDGGKLVGLPVEAHDIALDAIITETAVY